MAFALIYAQRPTDSYFESRDYGITDLQTDNRWRPYTPYGHERQGEIYLYRATPTLIQIVQQVQLSVDSTTPPPYYAGWLERMKELKPLVDGDRFAIWLMASPSEPLQHTYVQIRVTQGFAGFAAQPGDEWRNDRVNALLTPSNVAVTGMSHLYDVRRMPYSYGARDEWRTVMLDRPGNDLVRETGFHLLQWVVLRDDVFADADSEDRTLLRNLLEGTRISLSKQRAQVAAQRYRGWSWVGWLPLLITTIVVIAVLLWLLGYLPFLPPPGPR